MKKSFNTLLIVSIMKMYKATSSHMLLPPVNNTDSLEQMYEQVSDFIEYIIGRRHEYHTINNQEALYDLIDCAKVLRQQFPELIDIPYALKDVKDFKFQNLGIYLEDWTNTWRPKLPATLELEPAINITLTQLIVVATLALNKIKVYHNEAILIDENNTAKLEEDLGWLKLTENDIFSIIENNKDKLEEYVGYVPNLEYREKVFENIRDIIVPEGR